MQMNLEQLRSEVKLGGGDDVARACVSIATRQGSLSPAEVHLWQDYAC
jgi:hypothetical protein